MELRKQVAMLVHFCYGNAQKHQFYRISPKARKKSIQNVHMYVKNDEKKNVTFSLQRPNEDHHHPVQV